LVKADGQMPQDCAKDALHNPVYAAFLKKIKKVVINDNLLLMSAII